MNSSLRKPKLKIYSGLSAFLIRTKFILSIGKCLFLRKRYPLFTLDQAKESYIKTTQIRKEAKIKKIIKIDNRFYFSLRLPHWPSKSFDNMVSKGGLNLLAAGTNFKSHIDYVILGITRKCNYNCNHCYELFNLAKEDSVPIERWKEVIRDLQKIGASIITFSGGEPMLRYEGLTELLTSVDKSLSDFHLHTSGHGVTFERATALKLSGLDAAAVGLDDVCPERHDILRGYKGSYKEALQALKYFHEAGIFTYTNLCLTKDLVRSGDLWKYFELLKKLNVGAIQLLEPRSCGGYFSNDSNDLFSENDRKIVNEFFAEANLRRKYRDYPLVFYLAYLEAPERLGCMMGGLSHLYIDSMGNVNPCVFVPVSFGNIMEESFFDIYKRMRSTVPRPLHKQCPSIFLYEKIKMKRNKGMSLPIPYSEIEEEWHKMFE
jgi:MoaA/NifB/PqqE/SkfB family radical SAM enzyme